MCNEALQQQEFAQERPDITRSQLQRIAKANKRAGQQKSKFTPKPKKVGTKTASTGTFGTRSGNQQTNPLFISSQPSGKRVDAKKPKMGGLAQGVNG